VPESCKASVTLVAHVNTELSPAAERALVERDVAELLYGHGIGALIITAVAATSLTVMRGPHASPALMTWLGVMLLIVVVRAIDLSDARSRRKSSDWNGRAETRRFIRGVLAGAAGWAVLPPLFFNEFSQVEWTTLAIIVCAMASGSVTVLAAEQWLVITFLGALLLPSSLMFFLTPGPQHALLGALGLISFLVLSSTSRVTHNATMTAIRLNRKNQALMVDMDGERRSTEHANAELLVAQSSLRETLETLEDRIAARTADLARLASRDSLTGLYNRATLTNRLSAEIARSERTNASIAVLFVDLDVFKEVNDLKGHAWGDHVLREVANRLLQLVPLNSVCARWGGDEFVLIMSNLPADEAAQQADIVARRLRRSVRDDICLGTEAVHIDATIGIGLFPEHGRTADDLIRSADMAMYAAKQSGRGRVRTFDPALAAALRERHFLEEALREAITKDELRLVFQPIVNATTSRCQSLEALVRWEHPTRGTICPNDFIPLAERSGDIVPIGRWVLERACIAAASWPGAPAPAVSLNVSVAQIVVGSVVKDVRAALSTSGLPASRLHLEVTETVFAEDHKLIIPTLVALRAMGISISLDDFGTGFSSLSYLRSLPIDTIKIDKSFVDDVQNESGPIIKAIRALADALQIEVIAEGVETADDAVTLLSMGVYLLQGYLFAQPIPQHLVEGWLLDAAADGIAGGARAELSSEPTT
jgi:diguanylate cyclase (GGDEF)-like protein